MAYIAEGTAVPASAELRQCTTYTLKHLLVVVLGMAKPTTSEYIDGRLRRRSSYTPKLLATGI